MTSKLTHPLDTLTHLDGRNAQKVASLQVFFSERAWMQYRIRVMIAYLEFLLKKRIIKQDPRKLKNLLKYNLTLTDGERIQEFEKATNHDLRALELFVKQLLTAQKLSDLSPYVNLGIGSEDINNIALRLLLQDAWRDALKKDVVSLLISLCNFTEKYANEQMLARTHGQIASVTTFGKELAVYLERLVRQMQLIDACTFLPKFSGEVGNMNSLVYLLPKYDWWIYQREFVSTLGFTGVSIATQIPAYDDIVTFFDALRRLNSVLIDLSQDMWLYGSLGYIGFTSGKGEAGSSGMPHKINPQYFEGARGGLETANSLAEFFGRKLLINSLQREFSDSTVRRNFSTMYGLSMLSYQSLTVAFGRSIVNTTQLKRDLDAHWEICSETLHTLLKTAGFDNAYEIVRKRIQGKTISKSDWQSIIGELKLSEDDKKKMIALSPAKLTGISSKIVSLTIQNTKKYLLTYKKL